MIIKINFFKLSLIDPCFNSARPRYRTQRRTFFVYFSIYFFVYFQFIKCIGTVLTLIVDARKEVKGRDSQRMKKEEQETNMIRRKRRNGKRRNL